MNEEELKAAAPHVSYAFTMMYIASDLLTNSATRSYLPEEPPILREFVNNLLVEGALLYARLLVDFLFPRGSHRTTDIRARDFAPTWTDDSDERTFGGENLQELRSSIDRHLAHLTTFRVSEPNREWDPRLVVDIAECFGDFYTDLPVERRDWFGPGLADHFAV